jgi:hypothetical protein
MTDFYKKSEDAMKNAALTTVFRGVPADQSAQPVTATCERIGDYLIKYDKGAEVLTIQPN